MARKKPHRPGPGQQAANRAKREARAAQRADEAAAAAARQDAEDRRAKRAAWLKLSLIAAVVVGLVAALVLVPYLRDRQEKQRREGLALDGIGATPAAAGCGAIQREIIDIPNEGWHVPSGTALTYDTAPPAFGKHWENFLPTARYRTMFSAGDRPPKEQLVHSLEHGYTIIWYDEELAGDPQERRALEDIAAELDVSDAVVLAPWQTTGSESDGPAFPDGAHLAMTHWTGGNPGRGIWRYCDGVSGTAVKDFLVTYPKGNSPEPRGP